MERLDHKEYARLLDFLAVLHEPMPVSAFGKHLVRIANDLMPGMIVAFDQIEESSGEYTLDHVTPIDEADQVRLLARLREVYQQNPIYGYMQGGGKGPVVNLADLMPRPAFEATEFFQDIFRPNGIKHQVSVMLPREGWINTLTINCDRKIPGRLLTQLTLASRHIVLAHKAACQLEALQQFKEQCCPAPEELTLREKQVFEWLREGKRNSEIAIILGCAPRTVDKHVENILRKTGAETRTGAVRRHPA